MSNRAIIKDGRIVKLTINPNLGIEIGDLPKGVGFERLFWNGFELIDLADLSEFYVDVNTFRLSPIHQPRTELVKMKYQDRHNLIKDEKTNKLRVKTQTEIDQPKKDEYKNRRSSEYPSMGDQLGAIMSYLKVLPNLGTELEQIINDIDKVKDRWIKPNGDI